MNDFVTKGRYLTFVAHLDHLANWQWSHWLIGYIVNSQLAHSGMHTSQQPGDSRGGPWYGQLEILFSLITRITWKIVCILRMTGQSFIPGSSITIAIWSSLYPLTRYLNIHHNESFWIHHDTAYAPYWRNFSSHFLGEAVQRHDIHSPLTDLGRGDEIELRPIV